jgi:hypothetical protein
MSAIAECERQVLFSSAIWYRTSHSKCSVRGLYDISSKSFFVFVSFFHAFISERYFCRWASNSLLAVLRAKGVEPRLPRKAVVQNYELRIGKRAMLCPQSSAKAFGMVYALTDAEIDSLYGEPGLEMYRPESVIATFEDGSSTVLTTYNLQDTTGTDEPNLEYAANLRVVLERLGFPAPSL